MSTLSPGRDIRVIDAGEKPGDSILFTARGTLSSGVLPPGPDPKAGGDGLPLLAADKTVRRNIWRRAYIVTDDGRAVPISAAKRGKGPPWYLPRDRQPAAAPDRRWPRWQMWEGDRVQAVGYFRPGRADALVVKIRSEETGETGAQGDSFLLLLHFRPALFWLCLALWVAALIAWTGGIGDRPADFDFLLYALWLVPMLAAFFLVPRLLVGDRYDRAEDAFRDLTGEG